MNLEFKPRALLRPPHLQTLLASVGPRRSDVLRRASQVVAESSDVILECGDGVRLLAHHAAHTSGERDLMILLHGWEGSAESQYILSAAAHFYAMGYDVVRLNLRDHGPTHHLNRELFHSCRIDEVVGAVRAIQSQCPHRKMYFMGYSLGGNFGLRVALRAPSNGIRLNGVVAVCPVIDPVHTMRVLETAAPLYRHYFIYKWTRSLRRKAAAWPGHYAFADLLRRPSLASMTAGLVNQFTDYATITDYLQGYALMGNALEELTVPTLIVATDDDPIIPVDDFNRIARPSALTLDVQRYGGHCGFLDALSGPSWVDRRAADWFGAIA